MTTPMPQWAQDLLAQPSPVPAAPTVFLPTTCTCHHCDGTGVARIRGRFVDCSRCEKGRLKTFTAVRP